AEVSKRFRCVVERLQIVAPDFGRRYFVVSRLASRRRLAVPPEGHEIAEAVDDTPVSWAVDAVVATVPQAAHLALDRVALGAVVMAGGGQGGGQGIGRSHLRARDTVAAEAIRRLDVDRGTRLVEAKATPFLRGQRSVRRPRSEHDGFRYAKAGPQ